jgi:hypothetical protein
MAVHVVEADRQPQLGGDQPAGRGGDVEFGDRVSCSAVTS